jgi:hypothetical protein
MQIESRDLGPHGFILGPTPSDLCPTLYSLAGISLPIHERPAISERYLASFASYSASQPRLLTTGRRGTDNIPIAFKFCQLHLPFTNARPQAFVRLAPRSSHIYLDYGVYDTFRDVPRAAKAARKLEANRIYVLGQLVQLTEDQIREFHFIDNETIEVMKRHLATIKFSFGMRIPSWYSEFKNFLAVKP